MWHSSFLVVQDILGLNLNNTLLSVDSLLPIALPDRSRTCLSCLNVVAVLMMGFHLWFGLNPPSLLKLFQFSYICQLVDQSVFVG